MADVDLILGVGAEPAPASASDITLRLGPQASRIGTGAATLSLSASGTASFYRVITGNGAARLSLTAAGIAKYRTLGFDPRTRVAGGVKAPWGKATERHMTLTARHGALKVTDVATAARWGRSAALDAWATYLWAAMKVRDIERTARWGRFERLLDVEARYPWRLSKPADDQVTARWGRYERRLDPEARMPWGKSVKGDLVTNVPWDGPMVVLQIERTVRFGRSVAGDREWKVPWGKYSRTLSPGWGIPTPSTPAEVPPGLDIIVPVRSVYIVNNDTQLIRVADDRLLTCIAMSFSIDAESWTWSFSATLPASQIGYVQPDTDGVPIELDAYVNGAFYRMRVRQVSRSRKFPEELITVTGSGTNVVLGDPYAPVQTFGNPSDDRTAQQLMGDVLTMSGVGIGWDVDWGLVDWLVPAGAWSHTGTYASALAAIAKAAGGYLQPHPYLQTVRVLPRYPFAPWEWATSVTPDFELPPDVVTIEGVEWQDKPLYNRVYVSGTSQGVLGRVTRAGTAGDLVAPMVVDALNTHVDASRQRGTAVLSDVGRQAPVKLSLPVLEETGVITPGRFVRYLDDSGGVRLGIVRSTAVDVGEIDAIQTLGVETHVL